MIYVHARHGSGSSHTNLGYDVIDIDCALASLWRHNSWRQESKQRFEEYKRQKDTRDNDYQKDDTKS